MLSVRRAQGAAFGLSAAQVPAPALVGTDAPAVLPARGWRVARLAPAGRFQARAGARHLPNVERPDVFNRLLLDRVRRFG